MDYFFFRDLGTTNTKANEKDDTKWTWVYEGFEEELAEIPDYVKHVHETPHQDPGSDDDHEEMSDWDEYQLFKPKHTVDKLRVWVVDPHFMSLKEKEKTAAYPSVVKTILW